MARGRERGLQCGPGSVRTEAWPHLCSAVPPLVASQQNTRRWCSQAVKLKGAQPAPGEGLVLHHLMVATWKGMWAWAEEAEHNGSRAPVETDPGQRGTPPAGTELTPLNDLVTSRAHLQSQHQFRGTATFKPPICQDSSPSSTRATTTPHHSPTCGVTCSSADSKVRSVAVKPKEACTGPFQGRDAPGKCKSPVAGRVLELEGHLSLMPPRALLGTGPLQLSWAGLHTSAYSSPGQCCRHGGSP